MKTKRLLVIMLTLVLVLGMMPKMCMTVHAASPGPDISFEPNRAGGVRMELIEEVGGDYRRYTALCADGYVFDHWEYIYNKEIYTIKSQNPITLVDNGVSSVKAVFAKVYPLLVGGKQMTSVDDSVKFNYNDSTNTLTLNGFGYDMSGVGLEYTGNDELKIVLKGGSVIESTDNYGIKTTKGGLSFSGNGSLYVKSTEDVSAIYSQKNITIEGGIVTAEAGKYGVRSQIGDVIITGGKLNVKGKGGIYTDGLGEVTISGGTVTAEGIGDDGVGVSSGGNLTVKENGTLMAKGGETGIFSRDGKIIINGGIVEAQGTKKAMKGKVVNTILGVGWPFTSTDRDKAIIVNDGNVRELSYQKVQFPAEKDPVTITKSPEANALIYKGAEQKLVTDGKVEGGTLYYALGKDSTTAPTIGWSEDIPAVTDVGTYYVWYKVKGDQNHSDTEPKFIEVKINPVDKTSLNTAIEAAKKYYDSIKNEKNYAQEAAALNNAIVEAEKIAKNDNADAATVSGAITTINNAKADTEIAITEKQSTEKTSAKEQAAKELMAAKTEAQTVMNEQITVKQKNNKYTVKWKKVASADGYYVYAQYDGKKATKPVKTIKKNTTTKVTITKINGKKISAKRNFNVYVEPYKIVDGKKVKLGKSIVAYIAGTKNAKYSNVKKLTLKKSNYIIKAGKTAKIKASVTLFDKNKKHLPKSYSAKFRYKSSDTSIATVSKNGTIKGIKKGTCTIYVYSINGLVKKAEVTVK